MRKEQIKKFVFLRFSIGIAAVCMGFLYGCTAGRINIAALSPEDRQHVESIIDRLGPMIQQRRIQEDLAALTFEDLFVPLDKKQKSFLRRFLNLDVRRLQLTIPYQGIPTQTPDFIALRGQTITRTDGRTEELPVQFLPIPVYEAFSAMVSQMKQDIGAGIYVESGYRPAAYQLYLFLVYLKNHEYSVLKTARFAAWPGYSEHGWPQHQAIDIITEQGINGQDNPEEMTATKQYQWMLENAGRFGFEMSYPEGSAMAFEPWHWRYKGS